jgi:hypothetical protein
MGGIGEMRNTYKILDKAPERKKPLKRPGHSHYYFIYLFIYI